MQEQFETEQNNPYGQPNNTPPVVEVKLPDTQRSTALWILGSVTLGFLLPVCACMVFFLGSLASFNSLIEGADSTAPTTATGLGDAIAIVRVEGTILSSDDTDFNASATSGVVMDHLRQAEANSDVKAIVLRVDSPGGSVTGSAQIYEVIKNEITKPVIVSMAGSAASGGYYVSAPADYIFARADTVTGSIGVILTLYNAEKLIEEIGVEVINIQSGENKNMGDPWSAVEGEEREILEAYMLEAYDDFVAIIAEGRDGLSENEVRELADGRIYTGRQALELGLVDELGNLQDAINKAADLGGITTEPRIIEYENLPSFEDFLFGFASEMQKTEADRALETIEAFSHPTIEYRYAGPRSR